MNKELSIIILDKIKDAPYLDRVSGMVQVYDKVIEAEEGVTVTKKIPITSFACFQDCATTSQAQVAMIPDSRYKSLLYFEDGGVSGPVKVNGGMQYQSKLRIVCWLNTKLINGQTNMLMSGQIMTDIIKKVSGNPFNLTPFTRIAVKVSNIPIQNADIFSPYDYSEQETQYLMAPFEYFALDLLVSFVIPFDCMPEINCEQDPCSILQQLLPCTTEACVSTVWSTTTSSNVSVLIPAGVIVDYILIVPSTADDMVVNVGSSAYGNDLVESYTVVAANPQPVLMTRYYKTAAYVFISGIEQTCYIKIKYK